MSENANTPKDPNRNPMKTLGQASRGFAPQTQEELAQTPDEFRCRTCRTKHPQSYYVFKFEGRASKPELNKACVLCRGQTALLAVITDDTHWNQEHLKTFYVDRGRAYLGKWFRQVETRTGYELTTDQKDDLHQKMAAQAEAVAESGYQPGHIVVDPITKKKTKTGTDPSVFREAVRAKGLDPSKLWTGKPEKARAQHGWWTGWFTASDEETDDGSYHDDEEDEDEDGEKEDGDDKDYDAESVPDSAHPDPRLATKRLRTIRLGAADTTDEEDQNAAAPGKKRHVKGGRPNTEYTMRKAREARFKALIDQGITPTRKPNIRSGIYAKIAEKKRVREAKEELQELLAAARASEEPDRETHYAPTDAAATDDGDDSSYLSDAHSSHDPPESPQIQDDADEADEGILADIDDTANPVNCSDMVSDALSAVRQTPSLERVPIARMIASPCPDESDQAKQADQVDQANRTADTSALQEMTKQSRELLPRELLRPIAGITGRIAIDNPAIAARGLEEAIAWFKRTQANINQTPEPQPGAFFDDLLRSVSEKAHQFLPTDLFRPVNPLLKQVAEVAPDTALRRLDEMIKWHRSAQAVLSRRAQEAEEQRLSDELAVIGEEARAAKAHALAKELELAKQQGKMEELLRKKIPARDMW